MSHSDDIFTVYDSHLYYSLSTNFPTTQYEWSKSNVLILDPSRHRKTMVIYPFIRSGTRTPLVSFLHTLHVNSSHSPALSVHLQFFSLAQLYSQHDTHRKKVGRSNSKSQIIYLFWSIPPIGVGLSFGCIGTIHSWSVVMVFLIFTTAYS